MSITISTKVPEELAERIDNAREEGENTSACVRRLIRAGLDAETDDTEHVVTLPIALMWFGSVATAIQYASSTGVIGPIGLVTMLGGYLLTYESVNDRAREVYTRFTGATDEDTSADAERNND